MLGCCGYGPGPMLGPFGGPLPAAAGPLGGLGGIAVPCWGGAPGGGAACPPGPPGPPGGPDGAADAVVLVGPVAAVAVPTAGDIDRDEDEPVGDGDGLTAVDGVVLVPESSSAAEELGGTSGFALGG